ncbi:uncharacterized protein [Montipora foliosa]|uniref:uncharacterized protein isoform X1 n=2 Tax=Montipora foliosa TaxID=591990 RepID=UPI0035F1447F
MRKGMMQTRVSSRYNTTGQTNEYNKDTSVTTDMKQMQNPFLNLHPKLYHRQKNSSKIVTIGHDREMERGSQTTLRSSKITSNDNGHVHNGEKTVGTNICQNDQLKKEENLDIDLILNRKVAYLNQRNISLTTDRSASGEMKLLFPLISTPINFSRENHGLLDPSFKHSRESRQDTFPRIRCGSFISMDCEDKKQKIERHKRNRSSQRRTCGPCVSQDKSWTSAENSECLPCVNDRDNKNLHLHDPMYKTDYRTCKSNNMSYIIRPTKLENKGDIGAQSRNKNRTNSEWNSQEYTNDDVMVLKAKLHRSSFV